MKRRTVKSPNLTIRQEKFVLEYMLDGNGTQAAIRAGYAPQSAFVHAHRMLNNAKIWDKICVNREKFMAKRELSVERVLAEIVDIAFADLAEAFDEEGRLLPIREMPARVRRAISGIDVEELYEYQRGEKIPIGVLKKIRMNSKLGALEMLAKRFGLVKEPEVSVNVDARSVNINTDPQFLRAIQEVYDRFLNNGEPQKVIEE
jgi:phage terminase small subunit